MDTETSKPAVADEVIEIGSDIKRESTGHEDFNREAVDSKREGGLEKEEEKECDKAEAATSSVCRGNSWRVFSNINPTPSAFPCEDLQLYIMDTKRHSFDHVKK